VGAAKPSPSKIRHENLPGDGVAAHPAQHIFILTWWRIGAKKLAAIQESGFGGVGHACEFETSLLQHFASHLVHEGLICAPTLQHTFAWADGDMLNASCASMYRSMKEMSGGSGVVGAPLFGSAENGQRIAAAPCQELGRWVCIGISSHE
jgi:creatinine amidohydrolase